MNKTLSRILLCMLGSTLLTLPLAGPASARNLSYSAGHGVKCYYVLVSSVNGTQTYQTICRKSGV